MKSIKVKCPAKINLSLKITGKRDDGFHNIESVMQTINLFDYLTINVEDYNEQKIVLGGNSDKIPYDKSNLVYKAIELFIEKSKIKNKKITVYIDKNIPIAAGLAGGSTDGAGTIFGLNELFDRVLSVDDMHKLCASLGSDLNVCLKGGKILAKGRGEIIKSLPFEEFNVSLIKPINLGISAKEAYTKYSEKISNTPPTALRAPYPLEDEENFVNDLEWAIIDDYKELKYIKNKYPQSIMTGSGSTYFLLNNNFEEETGYIVINNLKSINSGVEICKN